MRSSPQIRSAEPRDQHWAASIHQLIRKPSATSSCKFGQKFRSGPGKPNQRKASSWMFPRGIPEQKFDVNRACFSRKNTRIHKNGRNSWTFSFGSFFGLVCRGDSWEMITHVMLKVLVFKAQELGSCGPGKLPKSESSRKWLGEGAKGLLDPASKRPLEPVRNGVAPVGKRVWVVQKTLGRPVLPGPKRVKKTFCTLP